MNELQFIQSHITQGVNTSITVEGTIDLNITPLRSTGPDYTITSCIVPLKLLDSNLTEQEVKQILEQATTIKIIVSNNNIEEELILNIDSKTYYNGGNQYLSFYYFKVEEVIISSNLLNVELTPGVPIDNSTAEQQDLYTDTVTYIEPFITGLTFEIGDYNVIYNNAVNSKSSRIRLSSVRDRLTINPTNIDVLIDQSATKAKIQDSYYSKRGWVNARYEGTKTIGPDYSNLNPIISGILFEGDLYTHKTPTGSICNRQPEERLIRSNLYTGQSELPTEEVKDIPNSNYAAKLIDTLDQNIEEDVAEIHDIYYEFKKGDLITIKKQTTSNKEVCKIYNIEDNTSTGGKTLYLIRSYKGSGLYEHIPSNPFGNTSDTDIQVIEPSNKVIKIDEQSKAIEVAGNNRIWVKQNEKIIYTDENGVVFKEITCTS